MRARSLSAPIQRGADALRCALNSAIRRVMRASHRAMVEGPFGDHVEVAKWQTHQLEGLAPFRAWGFKSPLRHQSYLIGEASSPVTVAPSCNHDLMTKNLTVRLADDSAADAEAVARVEGTSVNEMVKQALIEAIDRRRKSPAFRTSLRRIVKEDQELLERLAK